MKPSIFTALLVGVLGVAVSARADTAPDRAGATGDLSALKAIVSHMAPGSWYELPKTSIQPALASRTQAPDDGGVTGPVSVITAWNGAAFDGRQNWYFFGGGHADYSGNEVYDFDFATLKWSRLTEPSKMQPQVKGGPCAETVDNTPLSSHTYDGFLYVPTTKSAWLWPGVDFCWGGQHPRNATWEFDPASKKWHHHPVMPTKGMATLSAFDAKTGRVVLFNGGTALWFDPRADRYFGESPYAGDIGWGTGTIDSDQREFYGLVNAGLFRSRMGATAMGPVSYVTKPNDLPPGLSSSGAGLVYDGKRHEIVAWGGGKTLWVYTPATGRWGVLPTAEGTAPISTHNAADPRVFSKWIYIPGVDAFAGYNEVAEGVWLYRPSDMPPITVPKALAKPQPGKRIVCSLEHLDGSCNYFRLCEALHDAKDGDTIILRRGTYNEGCLVTANHLTIKGEPGAILTGVAYGDKGNLVIDGNDTVIEGLDCSRGIANYNGSCVRIEGKNVTLDHMHIHNEQMGVLSGGPNGKIIIENSLIENIGAPLSDLSHCVYISENKQGVADELIVRNSTIRTSRFEGHLIKSRALKTVIENNVLSSLDGQNSREIDIPQGGTAIIKNNLIEKGPASENWDMIGIALEPQFGIRKDNDTLVENNWLIFDRPHGLLVTNRSPGPVRFINNKIVGLASPAPVVEQLRGPKGMGQDVQASGNKLFATRAAAGLAPYPMLPAVMK